MPQSGKWVEDARVALHQSIETFCKEAHISPGSYKKIRRGEEISLRCCGRIFTYLLEFLPPDTFRDVAVGCAFYMVSLELVE